MRLRRVEQSLTEVEIDGEIAVYHPGTDRVVMLNASASEIWRNIPADSVDVLVDHVATRFGLSRPEARAGVDAGLSVLATEQLLEPEHQGPDPVATR